MPLQAEKDKFVLVAKRILRENLSTNHQTLLQYKVDIHAAYCTFVNYYKAKNELNLNKENRDLLLNALNYIGEKFEACLEKLNCRYNLSGNLLDIPNLEDIKIIGIEVAETINEAENIHSELLHTSINTVPINNQMAENASFVRLCASTLNTTFKGDPLDLQSFINSVELLKELSEPQQANLLYKFVKSKLAGKALEQIKTTDVTTDLILVALKTNIKHESSKVIEGRFTALRQSRHSAEDFSKKVETLADSFRRSLISEGFPEVKANEMTVEKTVSLCRDIAQSDITKSVLSASTFGSAQDVVAKFLTETSKTVTEKTVLTYSSSFNKNKRPNNVQHSANRRPNYYQNRTPQQNFNQNRTFYNNNFTRANDFNMRRQNNNRNWNQNQNTRNSQWNNNRDSRNIRVTHAENPQVPQESLRSTERGNTNSHQLQQF